MHFSFWEKLGFATLCTLWLVWGSFMIGEQLVQADESQLAELRIAVPEDEGAAGEPAEEAAPVDVVAMLGSADPEEGVTVFRKCQACHTVESGGAHKVGPNLWNVLNRPIADADGYSYSGTLQDMEGEWSYQGLSDFLERPRDYAPGTKMSFAGLRDPQDRADVIAYLRSLADSPKPLP